MPGKRSTHSQSISVFSFATRQPAQPVANRLYRLSHAGSLVQGRTDMQGYTEFVSGTVGSEIRIEVFGEEA